jgi:hypothetical protein
MSVYDFLYAQHAAQAPPMARVDIAPTPLLAFLAGEHAEARARAWPAPHAEFLALTAARRHLAAITIGRVAPEGYARLRALIEGAHLRDVAGAARLEAPRGFTRALSRLGETLWRAAEYEALMAHLRDADSAQILRHAEAIDVALLAKLEALPPALRVARIVALTPGVDGAIALAEAFALAHRINPGVSQRDRVIAWGRAPDTRRLFETALEALKPLRFGEAVPAPRMDHPYRMIKTRDKLQVEALRFANCIASYHWEIGAEQMAVYVREGEVPVMIALKRDVGGWRLAEALAAGNVPLEEPLLRIVAAEFAAAGVRIGQPVRAIEDRLETLTEGAPQPSTYVASFGAQIGLGQLWR